MKTELTESEIKEQIINCDFMQEWKQELGSMIGKMDQMCRDATGIIEMNVCGLLLSMLMKDITTMCLSISACADNELPQKKILLAMIEEGYENIIKNKEKYERDNIDE